MVQAQLPKLWSSMKEVMQPDERDEGALVPSVIGLQCADRTLADFQRCQQAGVRDAVALFERHVLIVRTPPNPGLGTIFKAMRKGAASVVPHLRIPRSDIVAAAVVREPPPDWRLIGDLEFLKVSTRDGDLWHWIDTISMDGKDAGLAEFLTTYPHSDRP